MRSRKEIINDLIELSDLSDATLVMNLTHVRGLMLDAIGHLKDITKIVVENRRHRTHIQQLEKRCERLLRTAEMLNDALKEYQRRDKSEV